MKENECQSVCKTETERHKLEEEGFEAESERKENELNGIKTLNIVRCLRGKNVFQIETRKRECN